MFLTSSFRYGHLLILVNKTEYGFLALTGAQGVTMSVCPSVCLSGTKCSRAVYLHLSRSEALREPSDHLESNQRALENSESTQRSIKESNKSQTVGASK